MRKMVVLLAIGLSLRAAAETPGALTFDDIVARAAPDPARLSRATELAGWERELAATSRFAREGPTLEGELGSRRLEDSVLKVQSAARIEVPILSGGRTRATADDRLRTFSPEISAADAVESRLRLRTAYLDAWLAQERLGVIDAQRAAIEQLAASVERRVAEGAEAPYESALVQGELLRSRAGSDAAREARGAAWSALRALAELPPEPQRLASPGIPELSVGENTGSLFEAGVLRRAVTSRAALESAFVAFAHAQRQSRWSAAAALGQEADESFATVGAAYRFPFRGESAAFSRERAAATASIERAADVAGARLATRFATVTERVKGFGPVTPPDAFDDALRAVALRVELGKERASLALPVRRQLLEARDFALQRIRDGHALIAELDALIAGDTP